MTDFSELRPQAVELFKKSLEELTQINSPEGARQAYHQNVGYITGLNRLGVLNDMQYGAMISLLGSTMDAKKVAPGVGSTESDKAKSINSILGGNAEAVKPRPVAHIHMELFPGDDLKADINGSGMNLSAMLATIVLAFRKSGMPEQLICAALDASKEIGGDR